MSLVMFRRWLWDSRWSAIGYGLGAAAYVLVIIAFYPSIRDNTDQLDQLLRIYPEGIKKAFGIEDFGTLAGFLGAEALNVIWPLIVGVFAIMAGSAVVAQEIDSGTVDLWLSVPERRSRLLLGKLAALAVVALVIVALTLAAIWIGAMLVGESFSARGYLAAGITMLVLAITMLAYSALFSSFMSDRGRAAGLAAAVTVGGYLAWVVVGMSDSWSWLRYISIFAAYKPQPALADGVFQTAGLVALLVVSAVCVAAALALFVRRDAIS
ncbi:MAG TPA: ABC transporter permease subunit [Thermomicrobiales bacterium]|nr:ABC transporter permease subunit [Thermomicrobiales bacterium]